MEKIIFFAIVILVVVLSLPFFSSRNLHRCNLEHLYRANGMLFGRDRKGKLVVVDGRVDFFEYPYSEKNVRRVSENLRCWRSKIKVTRVAFAEKGTLDAEVVFFGGEYVLLKCKDPSDQQNPFFAVARRSCCIFSSGNKLSCFKVDKLGTLKIRKLTVVPDWMEFVT